VLRIIQEALANVRKHAQASRVRVAIETVEGASRIVVADDGRGFDLNALDQAQHFGLRIMRERAESLGGTFHVESAPARGTIVTVQVPVTHAKGAQE
jgi:signal transduction histidine kinase